MPLSIVPLPVTLSDMKSKPVYMRASVIPYSSSRAGTFSGFSYIQRRRSATHIIPPTYTPSMTKNHYSSFKPASPPLCHLRNFFTPHSSLYKTSGVVFSLYWQKNTYCPSMSLSFGITVLCREVDTLVRAPHPRPRRGTKLFARCRLISQALFQLVVSGFAPPADR